MTTFQEYYQFRFECFFKECWKFSLNERQRTDLKAHPELLQRYTERLEAEFQAQVPFLKLTWMSYQRPEFFGQKVNQEIKDILSELDKYTRGKK